MNLQHLKYIVEVAKAGSISLAAENLFMNQPNLSKAIREVEAEVGTDIFRRTPRGIVPTEQGEAVIEYARRIIREVEEMKSFCREDRRNKISFSLRAPRSGYISQAFARFVVRLDKTKELDIQFRESSSLNTIKRVEEGGYNLGIVRCLKSQERYLQQLLGRRLKRELVWEFEGRVLISRTNPLASKDTVTAGELEVGTEILYGDLRAASLAREDRRPEEERIVISKRRVFVSERGSQIELLHQDPSSYMWFSPMPDDLLRRYGLVQIRCKASSPVFRDVLIYREDRKLSEADRLFLEELYRVRDDLDRRMRDRTRTPG
ncbi:Putative transcriptional regulator CpsY [Thermobacillus xylanilyticus]|uniref:Transcriptional regulator CpsY n=1 Tax=Thermobacillus xylanilyticus TaxID=76633 RepID=A0ABM8V7Q3_THEXY|nr:LysR family transcriptional regulator [Thermobacillus xylanilyticus]CAG5091823.1 Putative transcriptional regulator CpsY [Thermobacillus xylanilyticus]